MWRIIAISGAWTAALAVGAASARAQDAGAPDAPGAMVAPAPALLGFDVTGAEPGDDARVRDLVATIIPPGSIWVDSGPADRLGTPIGTAPRVAAALAAVGYSAVVTPVPAPGGVRAAVNLRAYERVRHIFVWGNWPVRQDEVQRRITVRPGQALPLAGPDRDALIERERSRIVDYLRSEGYLEANVRIDLEHEPSEPGSADVSIDVRLGPTFPIGPIQVSGNHALESNTIAEQLRHRDWNPVRSRGIIFSWSRDAPFSAKRLREDLQKLRDRYLTLGYPAARVTTDFSPATSVDHDAKEIRLGVSVAEHKKLEVRFEGNRRRSTSALNDDVPLFTAGSTDDHEAETGAEAIHRHYQEHGFLLARVTWRREHPEPHVDRVVYMIDEGPELKVRGVDFVGNKAFSAAALAEVATVRPYPFLGLGAGGYMSGRQVDLDAERLVEHYRDSGYLDARARVEAATVREAMGLPGAVAAAAETTARDDRSIYVRFTIEEGPLVRLGTVGFEGRDDRAQPVPLPLADEILRASLRLKPGAPYRPTLIRQDTAKLTRLMGDAGYASAKVDPVVNRSGDTVTLVWRITPGSQTRLGPVFIHGNFLTREDTILEQIPLRLNGGPLTTTGFERGQRNLQLLQLFNAVSITFPGRDEGRPVVPMVIDVEERHDHYGVFRVGGGMATDQAPPDGSLPFGWYLSGAFEHRNLFGRGWTFLTQGTLGNTLKRADAQFQDRRFFGTLLRLEITGTYFQQATVRLGDVRSGGGSIGFAREMAPGVDAAVRYNLRNTTRTEALLRSAGADEGQDTVQLGTTVGSVSLSTEWLRFDNRLVPTRGFKLDGAVEMAVPDLSFGAGTDTFVKVRARSTSVIPLLPWLSIRHGLRYDQGFPLAGAAVLPKVERYFAGGDTTLRGFELDRARAETIRYPLGGNLYGVEYRPLGGSLRILQNIDLQVPIAPPLYGGVFMDNGVVADSFDGLRLGDFRHGAGLGILVKLPIGDLEFGWGWPLDPQPGDTKIGRLHVNIGLMF